MPVRVLKDTKNTEISSCQRGWKIIYMRLPQHNKLESVPQGAIPSFWCLALRLYSVASMSGNWGQGWPTKPQSLQIFIAHGLWAPVYSKLHLHLFSLCKTSRNIYRKWTLIRHKCKLYHLIQVIFSLQPPSPHTSLTSTICINGSSWG